MNHAPVSRELFGILTLYRSRNFIFVEPGGNFGDFIIYKGAYKLAEMAGLDFEKIGFDKFMKTYYPPETIVYIHGGGGINNFWSGKPISALKKALSSHKGIVILGPQTFQIDDDFLNHFLNNVLTQVNAAAVYLFCRDLCSYERLKEKIKEAQLPFLHVMLDHDTALNLKKDDFNISKIKPSYALYCIRSDKELNPKQEYDFLSRWIDPITWSRTFDEWIHLHAGAKTIVTNRLHSAIIGTILKIPVTLLPNNYHKNRAVWEFSLRERGVNWDEHLPVNRFSQTLNQIKFLKKLRQSKVLQRFIQKAAV
jgi:exopolysaccharide biosynthesis predicted pyruvyltransferase EpsI